MRVFLVFIDGFGMGENDDQINPMVSADMPFLRSLFSGEPLTKELIGCSFDQVTVIPTDVSLGVPGLPQSATGQTALLTGENASQIVGRHINAYPTTKLRELLANSSIHKQLLDLGISTTSANMYNPKYFEMVRNRKRRHSATTIAALAAGLRLRGMDDLLKGNAVYQDITNEILLDLGYDVPIITPEVGGQRLARIGMGYSFCLFEYFQSDRAGHKQDRQWCEKILNHIDRFLASLISHTDLEETLVVITSDHGNIENVTIKTHTANPVPTLLIGKDHQVVGSEIKSIIDVAPAIVKLLKGKSSKLL